MFLLFDLDGTLTDPGVGITNSVAYALSQFGIEVKDRQTLYPFIGPPLLDAFHRFYGFGEEDCKKALSCYREYFTEQGIFQNVVYEGIPQVLTSLCEKGHTLLVATSKPEPFAQRILAHFSLDVHFSFVAGATMDEKRTKKEDVIAYALAKNKIEPKQAIMIGDREHDIWGAKANHLRSIGVLYGYGSLKELKNAGANAIAQTPEDILRFV